MSKHPVRTLLIAITTCLGWALIQPSLAADAKAPSTFNAAFAAARKAGNTTFVWNGKKYRVAKKTPTKSVAKATPRTAHTTVAKDAVKAGVTATPAITAGATITAAPTVVATVATAPSAAPAILAPVAPATAAMLNSVSSVPPFVFSPVRITPSAPAFVTSAPTPWSPRPNPYIVQPITVTVAPATATPTATFSWQAQSATPAPSVAQSSATTAIPLASSRDTYNAKDSSKSRSILPTITKVYPTGEKPMVVITFNCPTELAGLTTPTTKILHTVFDLGFGAINATDLLPWTLQQVCS